MKPLILSLVMAPALCAASADNAAVARYIKAQWDASVRTEVHESYIVDIPIPHTVPSPSGKYKVMFYWDTYFINQGLLRSDRVDLAKSNCDALLWWIDRIGYVPNSAFVGDDNRSQPPLLCQMVRELFERAPDRAWLAKAYPRLEREYEFWAQHRTFPNGLSHWGHSATEKYLLSFYDGTAHTRLGLPLDVPKEEKLRVAGHLLAEAESGQDFTPVYDRRALDFADVKLNAILCRFEQNMAYFSDQLGKGDATKWTDRASRRAQLIRTMLWDEQTGLFKSYDMVRQQQAPLPHLETFWPLWAGIATPERAKRVRANLPLFERAHGVAQTAPYGKETNQWGYPAGWPPSHWIAVSGLKRYGFDDEARRIAGKYCDVQRALYEQTGQLWEKFSVVTGKPEAAEYEPDPMLGWSAGVFLACKDVLDAPSP